MVTFILFVIAVLLIVLNVNAIKKDKKQDFSNVLKDKQENINDYDLKLGAIRKEYAENITEIQKEIELLREEVSKITSQNKEISEITKQNPLTADKKDIGIESSIIDSNSQEIKKLLKEGKSDDEICHITGLGKGEVLLIKGLLKY